MRLSKQFLPTLKEVPKEAEIKSHRYLLRAGFIRMHAAGVYNILPFGWRVMRKIMKIVREEMDAIGGQEFHLPVLSPSDIWQKSGRWETFGDDMFRLKDRRKREMCLAPTHEEVFTEIAAGEIRSYRDMPQVWYQIQTKFRDEVRPRSGIIRVRQFFMKDAYSLDADWNGLDRSYNDQREAYKHIFERCELPVAIVKASSGAMGGKECEEFMFLTPSGDDRIAYCKECGYAANLDVATSRLNTEKVDTLTKSSKPIEKVHTPDKRTIEEVSEFLDVPVKKLLKSLLYISAEGPVFALLRGDHQLNEEKLKRVLEGDVRPAEPEEVLKAAGSPIGFISPVGISGIKVIADHAVNDETALVSGANEEDFHFTGIEIGRDITVDRYDDLREVNEGEGCPECKGTLVIKNAIELGHIFKLGTRYSEALDATFHDENGKRKPIVMGSYGIGIERIMACAVEKNYNDGSMVWPRSISPMDVHLLPLNMNDDEVARLADEYYIKLKEKDINILYDDRDERAGSKFKDADLFGLPILMVIGSRNLKEGKVEVRIRDLDKKLIVPIENVIDVVINELGIS